MRRVMTKRMSTTARVMREWWKVDFISGRRRMRIAARFPIIPTIATTGRHTLDNDMRSMTKVAMLVINTMIDGNKFFEKYYFNFSQINIPLSRKSLSWIFFKRFSKKLSNCLQRKGEHFRVWFVCVTSKTSLYPILTSSYIGLPAQSVWER